MGRQTCINSKHTSITCRRYLDALQRLTRATFTVIQGEGSITIICFWGIRKQRHSDYNWPKVTYVVNSEPESEPRSRICPQHHAMLPFHASTWSHVHRHSRKTRGEWEWWQHPKEKRMINSQMLKENWDKDSQCTLDWTSRWSLSSLCFTLSLRTGRHLTHHMFSCL